MNKYSTLKKNNQDKDILQKFVDKKNSNGSLINYIVKHVSALNLNNIMICGVFLAFVSDSNYIKKKLFQGNFCKNRFCPMCSWRRAKKDALKISIIMKYLEKEYHKDFIFLTLTAPNVIGEILPSEITKYNKAFKKMVERKDIKDINKGYIRKLEVTYNSEPIITWDMYNGNLKKNIKPMYKYYNKLGLKVGDPNPNYDTYHVHFHIVIAVNKSYFTDKTYIKQSKWLQIWQEAMNCWEITQVDVRRLKKSDAIKEINEIAKYTAKDSDMFISQSVFDVFYKSLKGRQLITYNGLFKEACNLYKDNKLDHYKDIDTTKYVNYILYHWGKGEYVEAEKRELTDDERKKVNKHLIDEMDID